MHTRFHNHFKSLLLPCLSFSIATGFLSAVIVTAFKSAVEGVIQLSTTLYETVRVNPVWFPALVLGAAVIGLSASFLLSMTPSCRGGGIPTSITAIRGMVRFKWFSSILLLPFSALLTFFSGLPLGTEGPCVQMGTAIGDGVVQCFGSEKHRGWRRYIMTGGASAGFSIATASPIAAILFSMEELHKHFSPMLLTVSSISIMTAQITVQALASLGLGSTSLFHLPDLSPLASKQLYAPLLVGLVCGVCSILFTRFYHYVDTWMRAIRARCSIKIVFPVLFACVSVVGFFLADALGTGHALSDHLFESHVVWYLLIFIFLIRMVFMMTANTAGVTGGIFLPTISFGAIIGALCADGLIALGWIGPEHDLLMVVLGITAFLGATSRIPVTACVFAVEALGGIHNVLPVIIATTVALLTVEASGLEDFTDTIIESKVHAINKDIKPTVVEVSLTVNQDSFAVGKELRDILWPNACTVISFERAPGSNYGKSGIAEGDVITVHYKTYHPADTADELQILVGDQSDEIRRVMIPPPQ